MSRESLQTIIGMAVIDRKFREALLSYPRETVEEFHLSEEELAIVSEIRAHTIEQFAARLELWLSKLPVEHRVQRTMSPWWCELLRLAG